MTSILEKVAEASEKKKNLPREIALAGLLGTGAATFTPVRRAINYGRDSRKLGKAISFGNRMGLPDDVKRLTLTKNLNDSLSRKYRSKALKTALIGTGLTAAATLGAKAYANRKRKRLD